MILLVPVVQDQLLQIVYLVESMMGKLAINRELHVLLLVPLGLTNKLVIILAQHVVQDVLHVKEVLQIALHALQMEEEITIICSQIHLLV